MQSEESRFAAVSRRAFIRRAAAVGVVVAVPSVLAACTSDAEKFAAATTTSIAASTTTSTQPPETTTTEAETTTTVPPSFEMIVGFTYAASFAQRVQNPYIAVWVEDADGELVNTISLWTLQSRKGEKWLRDLRRWSFVDGSDETVDTISGATRTPGEYAVAWDGRTYDDEPTPPGDFFICIESAREHGPYSLIREPFTIDTGDLSLDLVDQGELSDASIELISA